MSPVPDSNGFDPGPPLVCPKCGYWYCAVGCPNYRPPEPPREHLTPADIFGE